MLPPLGKNEIRLLRLHPAVIDVDRIECDLQDVPLSDSLDYETLSYVWGTGIESVPILISGQSVEISQTLEKALHRLRLPDRVRVLWIDQICIDQQNVREKMQQVRLMGSIYQGCSRCVAWIGEIQSELPLADAQAGVRLLEYMAAVGRSQEDPDDVPLPPDISATFEAAVKALKGIIKEENPWWTRIWTVQEAALPKEVVLQWGPFEIPWAILEDVRITWIERCPQVLYNFVFQSENAEAVFNSLVVHVSWLGIARDGTDDCFQTIHRWRERRATDPRDKVYGLLGLCETGYLPVTEMCDYSIPTAQVFATLTQELIIYERSLRPLTNLPRQQPGETTPGIPTWALDLNGGVPQYSPDRYFLMHSYDEYQASDSLGEMDIEYTRAHVGKHTLSLLGVHVGTVLNTQDGSRIDYAYNIDFDGTESLLHTWYAVAVGCSFQSAHESIGSVANDAYFRSTYSRAEAFALLILGDLIRDDQQRPCRVVDHADIEHIWEFMEGRTDNWSYDLRHTVYGMMVNQTLFISESGMMGIGPAETQIGDEVWVFRGGNVPFVVRKREQGDGVSEYTLIGQCFFQGVMRDELACWEGLIERSVCLY